MLPLKNSFLPLKTCSFPNCSLELSSGGCAYLNKNDDNSVEFKGAHKGSRNGIQKRQSHAFATDVAFPAMNEFYFHLVFLGSGQALSTLEKDSDIVSRLAWSGMQVSRNS